MNTYTLHVQQARSELITKSLTADSYHAYQDNGGGGVHITFEKKGVKVFEAVVPFGAYWSISIGS